MNLIPTHQSYENFDLFGLLGNRFLFNKGPHKQPKSSVSRKEDAVKAGIEKFKESLQENVDDYNDTYGDHIERMDRDEDRYYQTITLKPKDLANLEDLNALESQIKDISINIKWKHEPYWKAALQRADVKAQYNTLQDMIGEIRKMRELPERGEEAVRQARRSSLHAAHERMTKATEQKELWAKKPAYKEMSEVFDSMADHKDFDGLFGSPDGQNTVNLREARELFLAIMAEKTNGFETAFPFGEGFGNNPEENVENFPFLYNEFLKHEGDMIAGEGVSLQSIRTAETTYSEAFRRLEGETAQDVAQGIQSGGVDPSQLGPMPAVPDDAGWKERTRILRNWHYNLRDRAAKATDIPQRGIYEAAATKIEMHLLHAEAGARLSAIRTRENVVRSKFTRAELSKPKRRATAITLAMRKFMKAQQLVDHPSGAKADWRYSLHPTVRRMLVASTYDSQVATYDEESNGQRKYNDKPRGRHQWMLSKLAMTDYFNFKEVGEKMDENHKAMLKAAFVGGQVAELLEHVEDVEKLLEDWIELLDKHPSATTDAAREKLYREQMGHHPPKFVRLYSKYTREQARELLEDKIQKEDKPKLEKFLKETEAALQDPYSEKSKAFIAAMKLPVDNSAGYGGMAGSVDKLGKWAMVDGASLAAWNRQMFSLEVNFRTAELGEKNMLQFFEGLGMNIEGLYPKYLDMIKKNPSLKAEHWDNLLTGTDAEFKSLIGLLQVIISGDKSGGKKDFIQGLHSLRKRYKGIQLSEIKANLQEGSEDFAILNILKMLEMHLSDRGSKAATGAQSAKDVEARLNGMHMGDRISYYVGGVWDMLAGPGQSPANRVAGLVLMYGMYKSARLAMKGDTKMGKALRALFVAGSLEIALKEITGRGALDRLGLDSIAGAMEKTYEEVLRQDAKENMEDKSINPDAHAAALVELNDVPFDQVMAWYEDVDPVKGVGAQKGGDKKFPKGIDLGVIGKKVGKEFFKENDNELRAKHVVYHTIKHFFKYVGSKDNKRGVEHGKEALKERWIKMYDDRDYKPEYSKYDHLEWFESGSVKKSDITWQMVMQCEIDPSEVDLTVDQTTVGKLTAKAKEAATEVSEWTQEHVFNPGSGLAEEFIASAGEYGQAAKKLASEVYEVTTRKVYFGKENMILWYKEHQYEIRRVGEDHWNLLVTGVSMPFKIVYAVDQWAVPWTLARIRQIEEIIRSDKLVATAPTATQPKGGSELSTTDITGGKVMGVMGSSNTTLNPHYRYYGVYQRPFLAAFARRTRTNREPMYHRNPATNVGYFISGATMADAKKYNPEVNVNSQEYKTNPDKRHALMVITAHKMAEDHFRALGMSKEQITARMDRIHQVVKTSKPEQVYVFYRMPLKGSMELHLKEIGRWADYMHADRHKDRQPFEVNPSQSSWENLTRAFMLDSDVTRTIISGAGAYAAQIPKFVFWNIEGAGVVLKGFGKHILRKKGKDLTDFEASVDAVSKRPESQRMWIDEAFTSAKSHNLALSQFYKKKENAKLYNFSLEFAKNAPNGGKPLHLGLLEDEPAVAGEDISSSMYLDGNIDYQEMLDYYMQNWEVDNDKKDDFVRRKIEDKLNAAQNPRPAGAGARRRTP